MSEYDIDHQLPYKRQREVKQPLFPAEDSTTNFSIKNNHSLTYRGGHYTCPRCNGSFSSWDSPKDQQKHIANKSYNHRKRDKILCPFCGLERGRYDPDAEEESGEGT